MLQIDHHMAFYDNGFDPRFSVDGLRFDNTHYAPPSLIKRIKDFVLSIYQRITSTSDPLQSKLKQVITAEAKLSEAVQKKFFPAHFWNIPDGWDCKGGNAHVSYRDHEFFERTSELFTLIHAQTPFKLLTPKLASRPFPVQCLRAIHFINAPQSPLSLRSNLASEDATNRDLCGINKEGFYRLNSMNFAELAPEFLVNHVSFIDETAKAQAALKLHTRQWRLCLIEADQALQAGKSFGDVKERVATKLNQFYQSYMKYIHSHEVLGEAYEVMSEKDLHREHLFASFDAHPEPYDLLHKIRHFGRSMPSVASLQDKTSQLVLEAFAAIESKNKSALLAKKIAAKQATL